MSIYRLRVPACDQATGRKSGKMIVVPTGLDMRMAVVEGQQVFNTAALHVGRRAGGFRVGVFHRATGRAASRKRASWSGSLANWYPPFPDYHL
jgi:hypothetical protein